jgi:membrane protein implicated in regulation of membrane protease activity
VIEAVVVLGEGVPAVITAFQKQFLSKLLLWLFLGGVGFIFFSKVASAWLLWGFRRKLVKEKEEELLQQQPLLQPMPQQPQLQQQQQPLQLVGGLRDTSIALYREREV